MGQYKSAGSVVSPALNRINVLKSPLNPLSQAPRAVIADEDLHPARFIDSRIICVKPSKLREYLTHNVSDVSDVHVFAKAEHIAKLSDLDHKTVVFNDTSDYILRETAHIFTPVGAKRSLGSWLSADPTDRLKYAPVRVNARREIKASTQLRAFKTGLWERDIRAAIANALSDTDYDPRPSVSVYIPTRRPENIQLIADNFQRQLYPGLELVICIHGHPHVKAQLEALTESLENVQIVLCKASDNVGQVLNTAIEHCNSDLVVKMDDDDIYGPHYVHDLVLAHLCTGAQVFGKAPRAIYFEGCDETWLREIGRVSRFKIATPGYIADGRVRVSGATLSGTREHFLNHPYDTKLKTGVDNRKFEDYRDADFKIAIDDGSQVLTVRDQDTSAHSWTLADAEIKKNATLLMPGQCREWTDL